MGEDFACRTTCSRTTVHKQLSLQIRARDDNQFAERLELVSAVQRGATAVRYSRGLSKAFLARSRAKESVPAEHHYSIGDQVFYWRGVGKKKSQWAERWHGVAVVVGIEGQNLW